MSNHTGKCYCSECCDDRREARYRRRQAKESRRLQAEKARRTKGRQS